MNIRLCGLLLLLFATPTWAISIALLTWRGETDAEKAFINTLKALGHEVKITSYNINQDKKALSSFARTILPKNIQQYDYIYTFGTTVTKTILRSGISAKKPLVFNIVTDPVSSGVLPSRKGGRKNVAGVSNGVRLEDQIKNASRAIILRKIAFLFNPREQNSNLQLQRLNELGEKYGYSVKPIRINPDDQAYMKSVNKIFDIPGLSAVFLPSDSFLISKAKEVLSGLNDAKIPTICTVSNYMQHGCLMGTVANYRNLGKKAAIIVNSHSKGKALADIPLQFDSNPKFILNKKIQAQLGL